MDRSALRVQIARVLGVNPNGPLGRRITDRVLIKIETGR